MIFSSCKNDKYCEQDSTFLSEEEISVIKSLNTEELKNIINYDLINYASKEGSIAFVSKGISKKLFLEDLYWFIDDENQLAILFSFYPNEMIGTYCLLNYDKKQETIKYLILEGKPISMLKRSYDKATIYNILSITETR